MKLAVSAARARHSPNTCTLSRSEALHIRIQYCPKISRSSKPFMVPTTRLRVSVLALLIDGDDVLLIHQMDPPEPDCWDLPGGGLEPGESLMAGLQREVREETGIEVFQVDRLLTVIENFFPKGEGKMLHTLSIVYQCSVAHRPTHLSSSDPEIGPKGIQWLAIANLAAADCSSRSWQALQVALQPAV